VPPRATSGTESFDISTSICINDQAAAFKSDELEAFRKVIGLLVHNFTKKKNCADVMDKKLLPNLAPMPFIALGGYLKGAKSGKVRYFRETTFNC